MVRVRLMLGVAGLLAAMAVAGLTVAQPAAPRGITAHAFTQEANALRARAAQMDAEAASLGAQATQEAQAQALRREALQRLASTLAEAEATLAHTQQATADRQDAMANLVAAAWFAQRTEADASVRTLFRLTARHVATEAIPAQSAHDAAQELATRLQTAQAALTAQAEAGEARLERHQQALAALATDHGAVLERMALAEQRARLLRTDPDAAGSAAPRLAAALFGPGGARTVLGRSTAQPGVTFAGAPGQPVVAPESGRIRFAGEYRSFGEVLVLELDSGYVLVFSGLDRAPTGAANAVRSGETIGAFSSSAAVAPELYVEVRRASRPVDPEQVARSWRVASISAPRAPAMVLTGGR
jgi:murein DD-endopeptidase MepM/ murein hydrolase activator NlpD